MQIGALTCIMATSNVETDKHIRLIVHMQMSKFTGRYNLHRNKIHNFMFISAMVIIQPVLNGLQCISLIVIMMRH